MKLIHQPPDDAEPAEEERDDTGRRAKEERHKKGAQTKGDEEIIAQNIYKT